MYKAQYNIGDFGSLVLFENWEFTQDAGGGNDKRISNSFLCYAKIEDRQGRQFVDQAQQQWTYEAKVVVRYNSSITSASTFVYNAKRYTIHSLSIQSESAARFMELRCSFVDLTFTTSGIVTGIGPAMYYVYDGVGGESDWSDAKLINRSVFGASKDGIVFTVIWSGVPTGKEVLYVPTTGTFTWGIPYAAGEQTIINYV